MKTTFYIFLLICTPLLAFSQVHVVPPVGDVGIGTTTPTEKLEVAGYSKTEGNTVKKSNASAITLYDRPDRFPMSIGAGAYPGITFPDNTVFDFRITSKNNILNRQLSVGTLVLRLSNNGRVGIGTNNPLTKLHVHGSITYNGSLNNASDKRLKKDVNELEDGLDVIKQLNPIRYKYNGKAGIESADEHVGIFAQNLQQAAPYLVNEFTYEEEDDKGNVKKSENYLCVEESAIKYLLINAVKEQQEIIEELKKEVAELRDIVENGSSRTGNSRQSIELNDRKPTLKQNSPNPFSTNTLIEYYVPANTDKAVVNIHDITGTLIHSESIRSMGEGRVQIEAGTIPAGTYNYSLLVNGKVLDTKQMIIAK